MDKPTRRPTNSKLRRCTVRADTSERAGHFVELADDAAAASKEPQQAAEVAITSVISVYRATLTKIVGALSAEFCATDSSAECVNEFETTTGRLHDKRALSRGW